MERSPSGTERSPRRRVARDPRVRSPLRRRKSNKKTMPTLMPLTSPPRVERKVAKAKAKERDAKAKARRDLRVRSPLKKRRSNKKTNSMLTPTPMPSLLRVKAKDPRMLPKTEKTSPPRVERKVARAASPSGTESGPMMLPMKRTARSPGAPGKANGATKARKVEKEKA